METKICSKCNIEKNINEFHKCKKGKCSQCKECKNSYNKKHYNNNKEKLKEENKKYYEENKNKTKVCIECNMEKNLDQFHIGSKKANICKSCKYKHSKEYKKKNPDKWKDYHKCYNDDYNKKYYEENKKDIKESNKEYYNNNIEDKRKYSIEYYYKHKEECNKKNLKHYYNNKEKRNENNNEYVKKRKKEDILFKLRYISRNLIKNSFRLKGIKKNSKTEKIIGCSMEFFKQHIELQFESLMSWENYGKYNGEFNFGWDLDHIIPISSARTEEELIKLNHYTNFKPLDSKINRYIKKDKTDWKQ